MDNAACNLNVNEVLPVEMNRIEAAFVVIGLTLAHTAAQGNGASKETLSAIEALYNRVRAQFGGPELQTVRDDILKMSEAE